jgi:hypothetical protein
MADEPILSTETTETPTETTEETTAPTEEATETTETKPGLDTTPPPIIDAEGKLREGWIETLPEELREEESLKLYNDLPNLAKALVHAKKAVGKNKIAIPTDKSTDAEWDAFYEAVGRPKTADDYKVAVPDDLQELFTDDRVKRARERAYKLGITQGQFEAYMAEEMQEAVNILNAEEERVRQERVQISEQLRQEFGQAYDERLHVAKRLVAEAIPNQEAQLNFIEKFGDDPDFIRFASTVGARMVESKNLVATLSKDTPKEAKKRIEELQATPGYMDMSGDMSRSQRESITQEINELFKSLQPTE